MLTTDFDYFLPPELIAQTPMEPRDASRLLVYNRKTAEIFHRHFYDIGEYLNPGDLLVRNQTRVLPARIFAQKAETGGKVEILLLRRQNETDWEALVGGKRIQTGMKLILSESLCAEVIAVYDGSRRLIRFDGPFEAHLASHGKMPLPPYIHEQLTDQERYQTIYANPNQTGSAAAPTAGLHFTDELNDKLKAHGVRFADVTLHVGLDTFQPVVEDDPATHKIHTEWCELSAETAALIQETRNAGRRVIAVGTTSARTLESAAAAALSAGLDQCVVPIRGDTGIFILPGYEFRAVDGIITNFHLPKSTLIMMISAFAGRENVLSIYQQAIEMKYRFFSFGDAMLIL